MEGNRMKRLISLILALVICLSFSAFAFAEWPEVAEEESKKFMSSLIGTTQRVLIEEKDRGYFKGHASNFAMVYTKDECRENEFADILVTEVFRDGIKGTVI